MKKTPQLALNLKRLREAADDGKEMSQEQLGALCGLSQTRISKYETGKTRPDVLSLLKLATGLRVPLEVLTKDVDMRFEAMYGKLHVSVTHDTAHEDAEHDIGAPLSMAEVLPGTPVFEGVPNDAPAGLEEACKTLSAAATAITAAVISIRGHIPPEPLPVARDLGPPVRPRNPRTGRRAGRKPASKMGKARPRIKP